MGMENIGAEFVTQHHGLMAQKYTNFAIIFVLYLLTKPY